VLPVDAGARAVSGVLAYADVASLPIAPDLAVVCAAASEIPAVFAALARRGTHAAVVPGMAEGLRALAGSTGVRSLGPGSFGIAVPGLGLHATRAHLLPRPGRIALVSQSAALCRAVLDWAGPNGVGFSHIVASAAMTISASPRCWTGCRAIPAPAPSCWTSAASRIAAPSCQPRAPRRGCGRWWRSAPAGG
jgi:acyl-CoA synthetase (NDP forming)